MSEDGSGSGGAGTGNAGGNPNNEPSKEPNSSGDEPKLYKEDFVNKLMDEKKAEARKRQELETKLNEIEIRKKQEEEEKLKQQGKYKEALEQKEKEAEEYKNRISEIEKRDADSRKLSAFLDNVGGLESDYWALIDLDKIEMDSEGQPNPDSVKKLASEFKEKHTKLFIKTNGPKMPNNNPQQPGSGTLTLEEWKKLPAKEMRERMKDVEGFPKPS